MAGNVGPAPVLKAEQPGPSQNNREDQQGHMQHTMSQTAHTLHHLGALLRRGTRALSPRRHPALWFWTLAFLLNGLLFLPFYLIPVPHLSLVPTPLLTPSTWVYRTTGDLWRVHAEWVILLTVWVFTARRRGHRGYRVLTAGLALYYALALVYHIYAAAMMGLYHTTPNIYNDYAFIVGGLRFVVDALRLPWYAYLLAGSAILLLILGIRAILRELLRVDTERLGRGTRFALVGLSLLALGQGILFREEIADPYMEVHSLTAEIVSNVRATLQSRQDVADITRYNPYTAHDYSAYTLADRPDIYLIFVESYGSILYTDPFYRDTYTELLAQWEERLRNRGWHMATTLSESPTWGGGSWMAYTSAMFGLRISQQAEYLALREKYQHMPYPNLGRFLHSRGYEYVWVVPITRQLSAREDEENRRFYGADRWITFSDLDYHGPLYGWGPSPPDQYTLGYIGDLTRDAHTPLFLFFLTQTSHYPWVPLPPVVEDWRSLAHMRLDGGSLSEEAQKRLSFTQTRRNYLNAITYDLNMLGEFILSLEDRDALVILMGDHQPPAVTARSDGYATPVHVLSRDARRVERFTAYGFRAGLLLDHPTSTMRHEELYEMMVNVLKRKE